MSDNDKTRNKLMESMRMTKSDPGKKPEAAASKAPAKPAKPAESPAAKKTVEKKKPTAKKPAAKKVETIQSSNRVWPD